MAIKAILFDLDGVLVDATEWHYEAFNRALKLFGFEITRYEHVTSYNGLPTKKKLEMLSCEKGLPRSLHGMLNEVKQVFTREEILMKCRPTFSKEYMIHRLKREGYKLAVCSNSKRDSLDLMLRGIGLLDYFDFTLSADDVPDPKPSPEIYNVAIRKLGLSPQEVMIVEDSPHGIEAAKRSHAHVCTVRGCHEVDYEKIREGIEQFSSLSTVLSNSVVEVDQTSEEVRAIALPQIDEQPVPTTDMKSEVSL